MLHEWLRFALAPENAPSTDSSHDVLVALIGAAAPLLLAAGALATTLIGRRRPQPVPAPPPPSPLNSDADEEDEHELRDRVRALERFLWLRHFDPNKIRTGEEAVSDVRFS